MAKPLKNPDDDMLVWFVIVREEPTRQHWYTYLILDCKKTTLGEVSQLVKDSPFLQQTDLRYLLFRRLPDVLPFEEKQREEEPESLRILQPLDEEEIARKGWKSGWGTEKEKQP